MLDLGGSAMRPSAGRKSIAPQSVNRRSSTYARGASFGMSTPAGGYGQNTAGVSGFLGAPNTIPTMQDTRPLRDKSYQANLAQEVYEFLQQNGYDSDMRVVLQLNALRNPTQKDFVSIFKWLYGRIDPQYSWGKAFDQDVFAILKFIRYPFISSISKSMLAAVGGSNSWPHCLALLHWMMQLVLTVDRFETNIYDGPCLEMGIDPQNDRDMFTFFSGCYEQWLSGSDDLEEPKAALEERFNERNKHYIENIQQLQQEKAQLLQHIDSLNAERGPLAEKMEACKTLDNDIRKFEDFLNKTVEKTNRFQEANKELTKKLQSLDEECSRAEEELQKLQEHVNNQGLLPADIDRINAEREKLNKNIQLLVEREREIKRTLAEKEAAASHKLETLERAVDRFNQLGFKIGIITTEDNPRNLDLKLFPNLPSDVSETEKLLKDGAGHQPPQILNRDLSRIRPTLTNMKREIAKEIQDAEEEFFKQQDFYDQISEAVREGEEEVSTLRAKKAALDEEYGELKEVSILEVILYVIEINIFVDCISRSHSLQCPNRETRARPLPNARNHELRFPCHRAKGAEHEDCLRPA